MTTCPNRNAYAGGIAAFAVLATLLSPLSGCDKTQETGGAPPTTTIGTEVDDSVITTKVRAALMSNEDVKSLDIKVTTNKGEVLLSGFADSQTQIDLSVAVAKGVDNVKSVNNKLNLKEGKQTVGNKIDDTVITALVKSALLADPTMKSLAVSVTTRKGEVQLSGFVDNLTQMTHAADVAKGVEGVTGVVNHISLKK